MTDVTDLTIPDPRLQPVPQGWATDTFAPCVDAFGWDDLDEAEAHLKGLASYIESLDADNLEFQKALRIVEFRRGVLLDPEVRKGERPNLSTHGKVTEDVAPATASRYRTIARHWDRTVWPHLIDARRVQDVSQAAVLRLIEGRPTHDSRVPVSVRKEARPDNSWGADVDPSHVTADEPREDLLAELDLVHEENERLRAQIEAAAPVVEWSDEDPRDSLLARCRDHIHITQFFFEAEAEIRPERKTQQHADAAKVLIGEIDRVVPRSIRMVAEEVL